MSARALTVPQNPTKPFLPSCFLVLSFLLVLLAARCLALFLFVLFFCVLLWLRLLLNKAWI
ncbi:hypothetical protein HCTETULN_023 [Candidatus Hodgkinia cicadicola]|nr:hypothetical protein HCTETULN_023 [Candidatus Hodgkinia cicadicola]